MPKARDRIQSRERSWVSWIYIWTSMCKSNLRGLAAAVPTHLTKVNGTLFFKADDDPRRLVTASAPGYAQSSMISSGTRRNSRVLWVTSTAPSASAWAAIRVSSGPMGRPISSSPERTIPYWYTQSVASNG